MEDYPDIGNTEKKPDEKQLPAPMNPLIEGGIPVDKPERPSENAKSAMESPSNPDEDVLEVRKSLLTEEQEPETKQNLFHRVTGTLSLKKGTQSEPTFGVKTAGNPAPGSSDEMQDDFFQKRLGTAPLSEGTPKPGAEGSGIPSEPGLARNSIVLASDEANKVEVKRSRVSPYSEIEEAWRGGELPPEARNSLDDNAGADLQAEEPKQPSSREYRNPQRFIAYNPKQTLLGRIASLNRVDKILIVVLVLAVIALIVFTVTLFAQNPPQQPAQAINPTPLTTATLNYPVPVGLHLPGGWSFDLKVGSLVDGKWAPKSSEWLQGTEIRRVIAIPWNKQVEAVFQTFAAGDLIGLDISNGDKVEYSVQSVTQIPVSDSSILYDTHPSIAIIIINPDRADRWVIVAVPKIP